MLVYFKKFTSTSNGHKVRSGVKTFPVMISDLFHRRQVLTLLFAAVEKVPSRSCFEFDTLLRFELFSYVFVSKENATTGVGNRFLRPRQS